MFSNRFVDRVAHARTPSPAQPIHMVEAHQRTSGPAYSHGSSSPSHLGSSVFAWFRVSKEHGIQPIHMVVALETTSGATCSHDFILPKNIRSSLSTWLARHPASMGSWISKVFSEDGNVARKRIHLMTAALLANQLHSQYTMSMSHRA